MCEWAPPRPKAMDAEWAECDTFILRLLWVQESVARRRESARAGEPSRLWHEASRSEGDARTHEKSRLPDSGRTFEASVDGRKGVRLESATLLWATKNARLKSS